MKLIKIMWFNEAYSKLLALNETYLKFIHTKSLENGLIITVLYYKLISFTGSSFFYINIFSRKKKKKKKNREENPIILVKNKMADS